MSKHAYDVDADDEHLVAATRRRTRLIAAALVFVIALPIAALLFALLTSGDERGWIPIGSARDFPPGSVSFEPQSNSIIIGTIDQPLVLANVSTHLGGRVGFCERANVLQEPRYGSAWDLQGRYILGPAPRGLDRRPTRVVDGVIEVRADQRIEGPPRGEPADRPDGELCVQGATSA